MTCEDLISIPGLETLKLMGGKNGLKRRIRWIYFADSMRVLGEENPTDPERFAEWIKGGELMVITSEIILKSWEFFSNLVYSSEQKKAAAMIIQTGFITDRIISFADEHEIPVFELNWELRLIDLSQIVCKAILDEENNNDSLDRIFANIIFNSYDSEASIIKLAEYHSFDLSNECTAAVVEIMGFEEYKSSKGLGEDETQNIKNTLASISRQIFSYFGIRKLMTMMQDNCLNLLFPSVGMSNDDIRGCFRQISDGLYSSFSLRTRVGIGSRCSFVSKIKDSLYDAETALKLSSSNGDRIMFYSDMGIMKLFNHVDNEECLSDYYKEVLGKLVEADRLVGSQLCTTLETYIENNMSSAETSCALYIHRNTLRYRLKKIEEILGISLENKKTIALLDNAFTIKRYIEATKE